MSPKNPVQLKTNTWSASFVIQNFSEVFPGYHFLSYRLSYIHLSYHLQRESRDAFYATVFLKTDRVSYRYPHKSCYFASYALYHDAIMPVHKCV